MFHPGRHDTLREVEWGRGGGGLPGSRRGAGGAGGSKGVGLAASDPITLENEDVTRYQGRSAMNYRGERKQFKV